MTFQGKQTPLPVTDPADEMGAWAAFKALVTQAVAEAKPTGRPEPLAALVRDYLDAIRHRTTDHTRAGYESYLRTFAARFGGVQAGQLDPAAVENDAAGRNWSDSNRANYLWAVQAFVRWAGRKDFSLSRPAKESRGAEVVVSPELHARVLRETTGDFHQLIRFMWAVGCRPMEGARLTAEAVDWASGTVTLKAHKMRRKGKNRILYLSTEALLILREQADKYQAGPLFRGMRGRQLSLQAVVTRFIRLSEKVGATVTSYHYRHTWATRALSAGIPDTHVAAMLGHSSTRMIHSVYSHVSANARLLREQAELLSGTAGRGV